jgi:hypothetical protein
MQQFAGLLLGLLAAVLLIQVGQGGPAQMRQWLRAKFLGDPA